VWRSNSDDLANVTQKHDVEMIRRIKVDLCAHPAFHLRSAVSVSGLTVLA
jgi:hypothetical protein